MRWIIGIVVVAVIVILGYRYFGGTGGVDVAEQVKQGAQQAAEATQEAAEATGQAVEEAADQAAEATQEAAQQAQETADQAAEATQEAAQQAQESAEQAAAGARQAAEQAAEATQEAAQATQEVAEGAAAGAQETLTEAQTAALTVGDVNVGQQLTDIVGDAEESLQGITDAASAEAAVPALTDLNTQLEKLSATVNQLPEDAKKVLADVLGDRVTELKALADSVTSKEGVGAVLTPVLGPIMAKLEDWAHQPA
jgi:hypothetical protein